MKYPLIFLVSFLLWSPALSARTGWKWGVSSVPSNNPGIDAWGATVDDSGNVLLVGFTYSAWGGSILNYMVYGSDTVFNPGHLQQQVLVKADSNGNFLWAKGSRHADCSPFGVVADHQGNVYVFGNYMDSSSCYFDSDTLLNPSHYVTYYLVKYSSAGNVIWAKNIAGDTRYINVGGLGIDGSGNIYVSGAFDHSAITIGGTTLLNSNTSGGTFDVFVAKFDTAGTAVWAKSFGAPDDEYPQTMTVTTAGNIYLWGTFNSRSLTMGRDTLTDTLTYLSYLEFTPFYAKLNTAGNIEWAQGPPSLLSISGLTFDSLENIYMVGTMDSGFVLGHDTLADAGGKDVFLAKYDSSGHVVWANSAGGAFTDNGWGITLDNCNNVWITGGVYAGSGTMNFSGHSLSVPGGWDPSFMAEYSADSGVYKASLAQTSGGDDMLFILANKRGSFYLAGDYNNTSPVVFGPDTLAASLVTATQEEMFIAKFRYDTIGCNAITIDTIYTHSDTIVCAPGDAFTLTLKAPHGTNYRWYDGSTDSFHIENASGVYWVSIISSHSYTVDTFHVTLTQSSPPCPSRAGISQPFAGVSTNVEIYPNPATDELNIKMSNTAFSSFTISDAIGQTYMRQSLDSQQSKVEIKILPPGLYYISFKGNCQTVVKKFVRE